MVVSTNLVSILIRAFPFSRSFIVYGVQLRASHDLETLMTPSCDDSRPSTDIDGSHIDIIITIVTTCVVPLL